MSKPNPYINTFYLAVHFALNILVIALVIDLVNIYFPIKHLLGGYHLSDIDLHGIYPPTTTEKNILIAMAVGVAIWYYQKRKARNSESPDKYHLPNLRELEEFIRSKF